MGSDAPRVVEEEWPEDSAPLGEIEIVDDIALPFSPPRLIRIEDWQAPVDVQLMPAESVTWELDVDSGVTVGIALRSSPSAERGRLGPFSRLELGGSPLGNGRHRVRITGYHASPSPREGVSYHYALTVLAQEERVSLQTVEPPSTGSGLMVDKSGEPPGIDRDRPLRLASDWQRVFLKIAPAAAAVPEPEPAAEPAPEG